jgi:competence protein ComEC
VRQNIQGQTGAFAAAIITGDRSRIDPMMLDDLRASNLAHLLAISGLHMGLLVGFVFALVRYGLALVPYVALHWPAKRIGAIFALIAGFTYLQISGSAVATERAYIMVSVMLVGVLLNRPAITLRAVALAATLLLVVRPESLMQAGFQMSFAATTALVASFETLKHVQFWQSLQFGHRRWAQPVLALVFSSFIAGAATAPFAAYHFNQFAQFGLIANFASVPVMGLIVMPSAVLAGLLTIAGLEAVPFWVMGLGIDWILGVANWVAQLKGGAIPIRQGATIVLPLITFGGIIFILWRGPLRLIGPVMGICALGIWIGSSRPEILVSDTGRLLGIIENKKRALNRVKGSGFIAQVWLENDGDKAIQVNAASRSNGFSDVMIMPLKGVKIGYIWPKKADFQTMRAMCKETDVLIAPNWDEKLSGPCIHITKKYLRYQGSIAIRINNETPYITNAHQMTGTRLWNTWWLRKEFD